jgi:hypothetical protein
MTARYNTYGISPKQFLCEVMWDETVEMPHRLQAADHLRAWVEHGDFREPDLTYQIGENVIPMRASHDR